MATALTHAAPTAGTGVTRLPDMINWLVEQDFRLPSTFDRSFTQVLSGNLYETNDEYIVQVALPGIDAEHVDIQVAGQQLLIKGTRTVQVPENASVIWNGVVGGDFVQTMMLPGEVDASKAEAHYKHGILTITLAKAEHTKPKSVKVSVAQ